jgi:phage baseplate assembly protein W
MMQIRYPYRINDKGRTDEADYPTHIRDLIEQVLFTAPGERVNRPAFGSGILDLVFAPNSPELATTTQFLIQSALQQWLGDLIQVDSIEVESEDSGLQIRVSYILLQNQEQHVAEFSREMI